ncbi:MAG: VWA domain-containing protein [Candidatus Omnitrophota bacterium]
MKKITFFVLVSIFCIGLFYSRLVEATVSVNIDVDKPIVLAQEGENVVIKVGLSGDKRKIKVNRKPLNIAIVLDKSGSMASGQKMENAKRGAIELIQRLTKEDIFSLITYDSSARVLIPAQRMQNKDSVVELIKTITAGGSTALFDGVSFGVSELRKNIAGDYLDRILLLSDGIANVGHSSTAELGQYGGLLNKEGIVVSTVGVGLDYNEDLMTALAQKSTGNSYFAKDSDQLPEIFAEEVGEAMTIMAKNIKIDLDILGEAVPEIIIGREGIIKGKTMQVTIGNLYGKNGKYALFEVQVPPSEHGRKVKIARINVEYTDPYLNQVVRKNQDIFISYDKNKELVAKKQNKQILKEAALTRISAVKNKVITLTDKGDYEQAVQLMSGNTALLEKTAQQCDNDKELLAVAEKCQVLSNDISQNKGLTNKFRKQVRNEAYTQIEQQRFVNCQE